MDMEDFNRGQALRNFPPEQRWAKVEGVLIQPRSNASGRQALVSIAGRDHTGAEVAFWTDLPNAMYLLNMLAQIQRQSGACVPSVAPGACEEFDGTV